MATTTEATAGPGAGTARKTVLDLLPLYIDEHDRIDDCLAHRVRWDPNTLLGRCSDCDTEFSPDDADRLSERDRALIEAYAVAIGVNSGPAPRPNFDGVHGFAGLQPFTGLPTFGGPKVRGVELLDGLHDDGSMLIVGHVGVMTAIAAFGDRLRTLGMPGEEVMPPFEIARRRVVHLWANTRPKCATYPMCGSLGPVADGFPCHDDDGKGHPDHDWSSWTNRPDDVPARKPDAAQRLRSCLNCNLYEADPGGVRDRNPCHDCFEGGDTPLLLDWDATPDTTGAFPITVWLAA